MLAGASAGLLSPLAAQANAGLRWEKRSGKAFQLAIGANGQVWALGADPSPGGFQIFKRENNNWVRVPGGLVTLAVDAQGQPWGTNDNKAIFRMQGGKWQTVPGRAEQVAIGGQGTVYALGARGAQDVDTDLFEWGSSPWIKIAGLKGTRIAVDENDMPWVVNGEGAIFRHNRNSSDKLPGLAQDIGIGARGGVWVIGHDNRGAGGFGIHRWNGRGWERVDGAAASVAVGPRGLPWVVNANSDIFERV